VNCPCGRPSSVILATGDQRLPYCQECAFTLMNISLSGIAQPGAAPKRIKEEQK